MMEDEVVRRRRWLTQAEFLDLIGITNLIPGPNSTEMAIHIGQRRAGFRGLLVAGAAFILPAAAIAGALGWAYVRFGTRPQAAWLSYGIKPTMIAIVVQALVGLAPKALKSRSLLAIGLLALVAAALGVNEVLCLAAAGLGEVLIRTRSAPPSASLGVAWPASLAAGAAVKIAAAPFSLTALFFAFAKIGSVLFGSGYVLLAFLRTDFVEHRRWLTDTQLLDAIAIGQLTPGPVFTSATFIGYLLGGAPGAALATLGIFMPAFFFVAISGALLPRIRRSPALSAFLDGVNVASLALMAAVTAQLCSSALVDLPTLALAVASAVLLLRYKLNSSWLIAAGALVGLAVQRA
jgi:chromate transporter